MIKALLLVTLLGQAGPGNRALKDQLNWQWWWNPAQDAPWVAKFGNPTCLPSGSVLSPGPTTLTVARANPQYVARANANQQTPGLITEDAGTVSHTATDRENRANAAITSPRTGAPARRPRR